MMNSADPDQLVSSAGLGLIHVVNVGFKCLFLQLMEMPKLRLSVDW